MHLALRSRPRLAFLLSTLLLASCASLVPAVEPGENQSASFEPGVPNFVFDAVPFLEDGETGIDVAISAPRATFIFALSDSGYVAPIEILARVLDRRGRRVLSEESWTDTLLAATFEETQSFDDWTWNVRMNSQPGRYVMEVAVESLESGARAVRRQRVEIIDPRSSGPSMFGIRMTVRRDGGFVPFPGMHLPAGYDSLRAGVELIHPEDGMRIEMQLVHHPSDTSVAVAPYYFSPAGWRLEHIGIDYREGSVVQRTVRDLEDPVDHLSLLFSLPPLEPGAYEVIIQVETDDDDDAVLRQTREFMVMPASFPRISTLDQMIESLAYIARRHEIRHLNEAEDAVERRARFDAFWGSLIPNRQEATDVMRAYYSRVEEANLLFSTYKEGWKTDRGMVYIVMGPPIYRQIEPRRESWRYSYGTTMIPDYVFERYMATELHPAFDNLILRRAPESEQRWERAVDRWRDGEVV